MSDYLQEGQVVKVKVLETDEKGRIKLSMKALLDRPARDEREPREFREPREPREPRAPREDRGERPPRAERPEAPAVATEEAGHAQQQQQQ